MIHALVLVESRLMAIPKPMASRRGLWPMVWLPDVDFQGSYHGHWMEPGRGEFAFLQWHRSHICLCAVGATRFLICLMYQPPRGKVHITTVLPINRTLLSRTNCLRKTTEPIADKRLPRCSATAGAVEDQRRTLSNLRPFETRPREALVSFVPHLEATDFKALIRRGVADSGIRNRNAQVI